MGRFNGNDPGNGRGKQGKGNFETTGDGDHILGTKGNDNGSSFGATTIDVDGYTNLLDLQAGDDLFNGFAGDDWVYGNDGDDNLNGGEGDDILLGGADDDSIEGGAGGDIIDGGEGNDTASYEDAPEDDPLVTDFGTFNGVAVSLLSDRAANSDAEGDELDSIENLVGSDFDDFLQGDGEANIIAGGDGDDDLRGEGGDDTIDGGDGEDAIVGGLGQDTLFGGNGGDDDTINAGSSAGRDFEDDVIVAAGSFAENGSDTVINYDESTDPAVTNNDVFDFSEAFTFASADSANWAAELGTFLTFDQPNSEIETAGDSTQVWFTVSELATVNEAEKVSVVVDNALFSNDGTGWLLVDDDILT